MRNNLFNLNHQIRSELSTQLTTEQKIPVWYANYPKVIDSLFEVAYFIGGTKDATSPEGHFYSLGHQILVQFPYTIRATCILIERGFYFEAISLIRNLFESFIQLRYFHNHKEIIMPHVFGKRITFKVMFEEIVPGFYDDIYNQFSIYAHSGMSSSIFRIKYSTSGHGETTLGSEFNELGCSYAINKIVVILFGILNFVPILFPQYHSLVTNSTEIKRKESLAWLDSIVKADIEQKSEIKEFYDLVNPLINVT